MAKKTALHNVETYSDLGSLRLRLTPAFFARLPHLGGLCHGAVDGLPAPADATLSVVVPEWQAPQPGEDAAPPPLLEAAVQRRAAAELLRRVFPLAARPEHKEDTIEDPAGGDGGSAWHARPLLPTEERPDLLCND